MSNSLIVKRLKGTGSHLPEILPEVAQLFSERQAVSPLQYAGFPPIPIDLTPSGIENHLAWLQKIENIGIPKAFCLSSHEYNPDFTLFLKETPMFVQGKKVTEVESIEIPIASNLSEQQINSFPNLVSQICNIFSAYNGYVYNDLLSLLHRRNIRLFNQQFIQTPSQLRQFIPPQPTLEGVEDILPSLLLENEFNTRLVPNGVWWINFWDKTQIGNVGLSKVRSAPWGKMINSSNNSMVLATTEQPINVKNIAHLKHLRKIVHHLKLGEIQANYIDPKLEV